MGRVAELGTFGGFAYDHQVTLKNHRLLLRHVTGSVLVWLGFHDRIISAWKTHRSVAALSPEHSQQYWRDRIAKVEVGMTLRQVVEILPPTSSIGSWARDDLGGQDSFYALDSTWAVSMLVDITAAEDNTLLGKPVLMRHHRAFNESGCLIYDKLTPL